MIKEPLTEEQMKKILEVCNEWEKETVLFLLNTGMHISVLCNKKKSELKYQDGYLSWRRPKTKRYLRLKVPKAVLPFIDNIINRPNYSRQYYFQMIKDIGRKAGIPDLSPLTFRHTFGVNMLKKGADIPTLKELMGVENTAVLMRYLKHTNNMVEKFLDKIDW